MLVSVATHVIVACDPPLIGIHACEINGKKAAKNGIARIRRGSGQNRIVVVLLNIENIGQQRQNGKPVIQSHTIDHHKKHLFSILHTGRDKFGYNIHRKRGRIVFVLHPMTVIVLYKLAKPQIAGATQIVVHRTQARIVKAVQFQIPLRHPHVKIDPISP